MINKKVDYTLYLVTDREMLNGKKIEEAVEEAIKGGVTLVQLREKVSSSLEFYNIAKSVKQITDRYKIPLIINDRVDIALAVDAAGVHVGQSDLGCKVVRKLLPEGKILGVSAHTIEEAIKAQEDGADYIGCGAIFSTSTKKDANDVSIDSLRKIKNKISIPVVAIGGINKDNISELKNTEIDGIAVISAILASNNIFEATKIVKEKVIMENI